MSKKQNTKEGGWDQTHSRLNSCNSASKNIFINSFHYHTPPYSNIYLCSKVFWYVRSLRNREKATKIHDIAKELQNHSNDSPEEEENLVTELTGSENSHSLCLGHTGSGEGCLYVLVAVIGLLLCEETYDPWGCVISKPFIGNQGKVILYLVQSFSLVTIDLKAWLQPSLKEEAISKTSKIFEVWWAHRAG